MSRESCFFLTHSVYSLSQ